MKGPKNVFAPIITASAMFFAAGEAAADYICSTYYTTYTGSGYGSEGFINVTTYTSPNCGGSFVSTKYFCTTGATSANCAAASHRFERQSILALHQSLQRAAAADQNITIPTTTCQGGGGSCGALVTFYSN